MVLSQTPVVGCAGSDGGVAKCAVLKSKYSVMSDAAWSRAVRAVSPQRVSINFKIAVKSVGVWETKLGFEYGETTMTGRRQPELVKVDL